MGEDMATNSGRVRRLVVLLLTVSLLLPGLSVVAVAQERRTLLQLLFGQPERRYLDDDAESPSIVKPRPRKRKAPAPVAVDRIANPAATETTVEKRIDARKILVVGDFLAAGLGEGLKAAFAEVPGVVIESRTNVSSGLVRDDYFDWPTELPKQIDEIKPAAIVVMLGSNDRQQMVLGDTKEKFRTDAWLDAYQARVLTLARIAAERHLPLLWVGLPAFQSPSMTADAVQLNGIFRVQAEKAGGEFIDVWDGFVDENGKFVITGSDINGQQVRLRGSDGLNLTKAGRRKLAFYLEKPVRRLLGDTATPDLFRLDASNLPTLIDLPPSEAQHIVRTQPISLQDPELDGGKALLGSETVSAIITQSARNLLVEKGELGPAPAGRVDDYRLAPSAATK